MKHLYNLNSNTTLLNRNPELFSINNSDAQEKEDKDFNLLSSLSMIENETDIEPSNELIEYLLNYSKSLEVKRFNGSKQVCVFNKN